MGSESRAFTVSLLFFHLSSSIIILLSSPSIIMVRLSRTHVCKHVDGLHHHTKRVVAIDGLNHHTKRVVAPTPSLIRLLLHSRSVPVTPVAPIAALPGPPPVKRKPTCLSEAVDSLDYEPLTPPTHHEMKPFVQPRRLYPYYLPDYNHWLSWDNDSDNDEDYYSQ